MATTTLTAENTGRYIYANGTWPQDRNGVGATVVLPTGTSPNNLMAATAENQASDWTRRSFLFFDLSAIPTGSVFSSVVLRLYVYSKSGAGSVDVTKGFQANPVVAAGFDTAGYTQRDESTERATLTLAGITAGQYNSWTFGTDGKTLLRERAGNILRLCIRSDYDVNNVQPPGTSTNGIYFYMTQESNKEPKLDITYSSTKFPSDPVARVTTIRHIVRPGSYRMEMGVGSIGLAQNIRSREAMPLQHRGEMKTTIDPTGEDFRAARMLQEMQAQQQFESLNLPPATQQELSQALVPVTTSQTEQREGTLFQPIGTFFEQVGSAIADFWRGLF